MGLFPISFGNEYILLAVDYVFKGIYVMPIRTNEDKVVVKFLRENIFSRYGIPRVIIKENLGTHFNNQLVDLLLRKHSNIHKLVTPLPSPDQWIG